MLKSNYVKLDQYCINIISPKHRYYSNLNYLSFKLITVKFINKTKTVNIQKFT